MLKSIAGFALSVALVAGCTTTPQGGPVRLDASSAEAAEASYQAMLKNRSEAGRQALALAVLMLNMEGVKSAHEALANPELDSPSIARVRDKVAGMTAEEIIKRARQNPAVRIVPAGE